MRFPGFSDSWDTYVLAEIAQFSKGKGISKSDIHENGEIDCIRYGELYTHYEEVITEIRSKTNIEEEDLILSEANDVIIPSSGETKLDIATASCVIKSGIALGGDLNIIKTPNNGIFFSYYLNSKKKIEIARLSQGVSVVHLYSRQLASLHVILPSIVEQNKIADFFYKIDKRISTQNEIIENLESLKKSLCQKIFSQEIRFKDENENTFQEWKKTPLGKLLVEVNDKTTKSNQYPILSSTTKGLFNQSDYFTRDIASKDNSGYKILKMNQLVFSPQNLWLGNINVNTQFKVGIVSPSYKIFSFNNKTTTFVFCKYLLFTPRMLFEYAQASEQGASVVRRNLDMSSFKAIKVNLPCIEEQEKIADFLSKIDDKIQVEKQTLECLTKQKQYFLQQLFI